MSYQTTIGWSLIASGIVTIALTQLPYPSLYWGVGFLLVGLFIFVVRRLF